MEVVFAALGLAFAAFCIWLAVRIINRSERWARWTAVGLVVALSYPLSFEPACWISDRTGTGASALSAAYQPVLRVWMSGTHAGSAVYCYAKVGTRDGKVATSKSRVDGWLTIFWQGMM